MSLEKLVSAVREKRAELDRAEVRVVAEARKALREAELAFSELGLSDEDWIVAGRSAGQMVRRRKEEKGSLRCWWPWNCSELEGEVAVLIDGRTRVLRAGRAGVEDRPWEPAAVGDVETVATIVRRLRERAEGEVRDREGRMSTAAELLRQALGEEMEEKGD